MLQFLDNFSFSKMLLPIGLAAVALLVLSSIYVIATKVDVSRSEHRGWISRILYFVFALSILALAATSFGSILKQGHMNNYALIAHAGLGGVFVVLLLGIAWLYLPSGAEISERWRGERWTAWALVLASMLTAGSMIISMLPILSTQELIDATRVHRFTGLATLIALAFHSCSLLAGRLGYR